MAYGNQKQLFITGLGLSLVILLGWTPIGCSKDKDRSVPEQRTFSHYNPYGLNHQPPRGPVVGSGLLPHPGHKTESSKFGRDFTDALELLVLHGKNSGEAVMKGLVEDLEAGRLLLRYPGANGVKYYKPHEAGLITDVCTQRFQKNIEDSGQIDFETFKACDEPLFLNLKTLSQFFQAKRRKVGFNAYAARIGYAHVIASQWVLSRAWREDKTFFYAQPKLFEAIFAGDLAWREGSGVSESFALTYRGLWNLYQMTQSLKINQLLDKAGMTHPLSSRMLNNREKTINFVEGVIVGELGWTFGTPITSQLYDKAYQSTNFSEFVAKLEVNSTQSGLFIQSLQKVREEWNLDIMTGEEE